MSTEYRMQQIHQMVLQSKKILLLTHENPDTDAVGSLLSFAYYLNLHHIPYRAFFKELSGHYETLIPYKSHYTVHEGVLSETYDLIAVFDAGDMKYTGVEHFLKNITGKIPIIVFDHHASNIFFGDINIVKKEAASTTEIIYEYFQHIGIPITKTVSFLLLAGILADTNHFTNHNTTSRSIRIASDLLKTGVPLRDIKNVNDRETSIDDLRIIGKIVSNLKKNEHLNIASIVVQEKDLENCKNKKDVLEHLSQLLNKIGGVKISLIIREVPPNTIKVSMRTNNDLINLAEFARMFGGGGHPKAAGFHISGRLIKTESGWRVI